MISSYNNIIIFEFNNSGDYHDLFHHVYILDFKFFQCLYIIQHAYIKIFNRVSISLYCNGKLSHNKSQI